MKRSFLLLLIFLGSLHAFSQTQPIALKTVASGGITVCGESITFTIEIKNLSGTDAFTNVIVNSDMPEGISFDNGGLVTGGIYSPGTPEDLSNPFFTVDDINPGEIRNVTFQAKANCELINYLQVNNVLDNLVNNQTSISYNINQTSYTYAEPNGSESYNVLYAELEIPSLTTTPSQEFFTNGEIATRSFTVRKSGTGTIRGKSLGGNGIEIDMVYSSGLQFVGLTSNAAFSTLPNGSVETVSITDFSGIGDGDDIFEDNEEITFTEKAKIVSCVSVATTDFKVKWGCNGNFCNFSDPNTIRTGEIKILDGQPNISFSQLGTYDFCGSREISLEFTNTGSGSAVIAADRAMDFSIDLSEYIYSSQYKIGTISNIQIRLTDGTYKSVLELPVSVQQTDNRHLITFTGGVSAGIAGLTNLDNDNIADDLPVNGTVGIKFDLNITCPSFFSDASIGHSFRFFDAYTHYNDACGNADSRFFTGPRYQIRDLQQEITGPSDLEYQKISSQYTLTVSKQISQPSQCIDEIYYSTLKVPTGVEISGDVIWQSSNGTSIVVPYTKSGDTYTLNGGGTSGSYVFSLILNDCSVSPTGFTNIEWKLFQNCGTCSCPVTLADQTYQSYLHCGGCTGVTTNSFTVKRTSLGYPEPVKGYYTFGELETTQKYSDLSTAEAAGVRVKAGLEMDEIVMEAKGEVTGGIFDNMHVRIVYTSPLPENIFEYLSADFIINSTVYHLSSASQPIDLGNNNYAFVFDVPASPTGPSSFNQGDLIDLVARFKIRKLSNFQGNEYFLQNIRSSHYTIVNGIEDGCESFGDYFTLYRYSLFPSSSISSGGINRNISTGSGECNKHDNIRTRLQTDYPYLYDIFPNEFRPYGQFNTIHLDFPEGFTFDEGSSILEIRYKNSLKKVSLPDPQIGIFDGKRSLDYFQNSTWPVADITYPGTSISLIFKYIPICSHSLPSTIDFTHNFDYSTKRYIPDAIEEYSGTGKSKLSVYKPNLEMVTGGVKDAFEKTVSWDIQLLNKPETNKIYTEAASTYLLFIPPDGNINLVSATGSNGETLSITSYDPAHPEKKKIEVGNLPVRLDPYLVKLYAEYSKCVSDESTEFIDNVSVKAFASCYGYPIDPENPVCAITPLSGTVSIRYKESNLQWLVTKLATESQLCEPVPFNIYLESSRSANMNDVTFQMKLPDFGVSLDQTSAQFEYPAGSGTWLNLPQASFFPDEKIGWNLADIANLNPFPGTHKTTPIDANKLNIKFNLLTSCGSTPETSFNPGDPVLFFASGTKNCQEHVNLTDQRKLNLLGVDLDIIDVNLITGNFSVCASTVPMDVNVKNIGTSVTASDILEVILPSGVDYLSGSAPTEPVRTVNSDETIRLRWTLAALQPQEEFNLSFESVLDPAVLGTGEVDLIVKSSMPVQATCITDGQSCSLRATTGSFFVQKTISSEPVVPVITISGPCAHLPHSVGKPLSFSLLNGTVGTTYDWDIFNDGIIDHSSSSLNFSYSFQIHGTHEIKVIANSGGCTVSSEVITVEILPKVGLEIPSYEFCEGELVTFHINPVDYAPEEYLWYKDGLLIQNGGHQLNANSAGVYTVVVKPLSCVPDPIVFEDAQLPEVDAPYYLASAVGTYETEPCPPPCSETSCILTFEPQPGKKYVISAWARQNESGFVEDYLKAGLKVDFVIENQDGTVSNDASLPVFRPNGDIIDGWQRIEGEFEVPQNSKGIELILSGDAEIDIYYDDLRINPFDGSMKTYVYDPYTLRLMAILDERNFATIYEYDQEGKLIRVKKETEKGIITIQESLDNIHKQDQE